MKDLSATGGVDEVDKTLVKAAKGGDMAAMDQLLLRHQAYVDHLCRRMLRNPTDAEDARQEAWFNAARRIATFNEEAAFRTWLHRITTNVCLNIDRKRKADNAKKEAFEPVSLPKRPGVLGPVSNAARWEDSVAAQLDVEAALNAVTPVFREVLVRRLICDMPYADIAEDLGIDEGTVKSRLFRGKAELVELLREHVDLPGVPASTPGPAEDPLR
jgi:RNA polymerase sigma-70 factor, ECF subfamily